MAAFLDQLVERRKIENERVHVVTARLARSIQKRWIVGAVVDHGTVDRVAAPAASSTSNERQYAGLS
jgi:hypothetical protein